MNLENAYLMTGDITHIDCVLLGVLGVLCANLEDKPLLSEPLICWQANCQKHQCNTGKCELYDTHGRHSSID